MMKKGLIFVIVLLGICYLFKDTTSMKILQYKVLPPKVMDMLRSSEEKYLMGDLFLYGRNGQKKDLKRGIEYLKSSAESGYADAQYTMFKVYSKGIGCKIDIKKAYQWLEKAAENGNPYAQYKIARSYLYGDYDTKINKKEGVKWIEKSANSGRCCGMFKMGKFYHMGLYGFEKNQKKAVEWLNKAVRKKCKIAIKFKKAHNDFKNMDNCGKECNM